jgi:hypothetical protein
MAKLTVYIPDDLIDRVRARDPEANTSQLVQRGLERLSPAEDAGYARRPDDAEELLAVAADRLRQGAAREYQRGYRAALSTVSKAGELLWPGLDELARKGFDLFGWAQSWRGALGRAGMGVDPPDWWDPLVQDLGDLLNPFDVGPMFMPTTTFVRGYEAALRDAWEAAERPGAISASRDTHTARGGEEVAEPGS